MMIDLHQRLLTAALCLLLGGCASLATTPRLDEPVTPTVANTLGESATGRVMAVESDELTIDGVSTGTPYTAASGKTCKRLYNAVNKVLPRVVCQSANGEWYLQRSLGVSESTRAPTTIVSAQPVAIARGESTDGELIDIDSLADTELLADNGDGVSDYDNKDDAEFVERPLQSGETLWSFAQRLTGNGINWHQIAEVNNIDDARQLDANATLKIPTGLLKAGQ